VNTVTPSELDTLRLIAVRAVQAAMDVVVDWRERGLDLGVRTVDAESVYDRYVTAVDDAAEAAVLDVLHSADPATPAVGDVSGGEIATGRVWVIDPIDGTTNLVHGESFVGVTLALLADGQPLVAATGCPFTGELWSAARGVGAYDRDGRRLRMREGPREGRCVALDPAAPPPAQRSHWEDAYARTQQVCREVAPRASIALALAYVAAGIFDGFVQLGGAQIQDFAAGTLLIREAGGAVTGLDGSADPWRTRVNVAGTTATYQDLCAALTGLSAP
jgi:myo-inositol-1(or 4)-monophosphatase